MKFIDKFAVFAFTMLAISSIAAAMMNTIIIYSDSQCNGTPVRVFMAENSSCSASECTEGDYNGGVQYRKTDCTDANRHEYIAEVFNGVSYVTLDHYDEVGCTNLTFSSTYLAAGTCQSGTTNATVITKLFSNGSASVQGFEGLTCGTQGSHFSLTEELISNHTCIHDRYKFYASTSDVAAGLASSSSSAASSESAGSSSGAEDSAGLGTGATIGVVIGGFVLLLLCVVVFMLIRRRIEEKHFDNEPATPAGLTPTKGAHGSLKSSTAQAHSVTDPTSSQEGEMMTGTMTGMWNDETIVAARLPREKVVVKERISRGGYGEVYLGTFNEQVVAVKVLLPENRKSISHVNEFLSEVKMMAMMEHPRITKFIGVAWDSLSDLCVVSEYMAGGDLRALLGRFEEEQLPKGFDKDKIRIALHIAHALTYLHSLESPVIHRDLKSKNILLSTELDAKLTDFGISRERVDQTMTAGVGTSLWMAPEVMFGEKYDDKADMFSFGVVLSELDSHSLPYASVKDSSNSERKMPDAVILQRVMLGKLTVEFTHTSYQSMRDLGVACVSVDPADRPTSAEALGKLHQIFTHEMNIKT